MKRTFGWFLVALGVLAFAIYLLGLIDPVGTKGADDGDPFGTPDPWYVAVIGMVASGSLVGLGAWCIRTQAKKPIRPPP